MHNCRETKELITELLLDEDTGRPDEILTAELHRCAECRSEFEALNATLRITTRLKDISAPPETYWASYHAKLRQKLVNTNISDSHGPSLIVRLFRSSVRVPTPVAIAAIVVFAVLLPVRTPQQRSSQAPAIVRVPVEVPVVHEKIVTRVVYRDRRSRARSSKRLVNTSTVDGTFAKSRKPRNEDIPSLVGFKPTEEVKLTVIKGGSTNEK